MAAILIVEDDKTTNDMICDYLQDAGHTVYQAYDGRRALALFAEAAIELVILDIMLPYINGMQVLSEIREGSMVPVLMLTALNDEWTQINSFDSLADDYITKPFSMVLLGKRVLALLHWPATAASGIRVPQAVFDEQFPIGADYLYLAVEGYGDFFLVDVSFVQHFLKDGPDGILR